MNKFFESVMLRKEARRGAEIVAAHNGDIAAASAEYNQKLHDAVLRRLDKTVGNGIKRDAMLRDTVRKATEGSLTPRVSIESARKQYKDHQVKLNQLYDDVLAKVKALPEPDQMPSIQRAIDTAQMRHRVWSTPLTVQDRATLATNTGDRKWLNPKGTGLLRKSIRTKGTGLRVNGLMRALATIKKSAIA